MKNIKFFVLVSLLHFGILSCYYMDCSGRIHYCHNSSPQKSNKATTLIGLAKAGFNFAKSFVSSSFSSKQNTCSCDSCKVKQMSTQDVSDLYSKLHQSNSAALYTNRSNFEQNWHELGFDRLSSKAQKELRNRLSKEERKRSRSKPVAIPVVKTAAPVKSAAEKRKDAVHQNFINSKKEIEKYRIEACQKNQRRADAARRAIENNFRTTFQRYDLSVQAQQLLRENNIEFAQFQECVGNEMQQQIHQEFIDVLNDGAALYACQDINALTDRWYSILSNASSVGCMVNNVGCYALAHNIVDICEGLYQIEEKRAYAFFNDSAMSSADIKELWFSAVQAWQNGCDTVADFTDGVIQKSFGRPVRWLGEFSYALQNNSTVIFEVAEGLILDAVEYAFDSIKTVDGILRKPLSRDTLKQVATFDQKWMSPVRKKVLRAADVFWQMPAKEKTQEVLALGVQVVAVVSAAKLVAVLPAYVSAGKGAILLQFDKLSKFSGPTFQTGVSPSGQALVTLEAVDSVSESIITAIENGVEVVGSGVVAIATPAGADAACNLALALKEGVSGAVGRGGPNSGQTSYGRKTKAAREKAQKVRKRVISPPDDIVEEYRCFVDKRVEWTGNYNRTDIQSQSLPKKLTFTEKTLDHIFSGKVKKLPRNGPLRVSGYHSDFKGRALKQSSMNSSQLRDAETGAIMSDIRLCGKGVFKTLFPESWRPEQVMKAVENAMKNVFEIEAGFRGRVIIRGKTDLGMVIELVAEGNGDVVTFYPKISGV